MRDFYLSGFQHTRPKYELSQEAILEWLAAAHARAEAVQKGWDALSEEEYCKRLQKQLLKLGFGPGKVVRRGSELGDILHRDWERMEIYNLTHASEGHDIAKRSAFFAKSCTEAFKSLYPLPSPLPPHLMHVTCTGYVAPSPAQSFLSGANMTVTHVYHMGCYASIPALRIACGFAQGGEESDIVHTELCSLHLNPALHTLDQLVAQSLFADGFIKYRVSHQKQADKGFRIWALREEILPESLSAMEWSIHPWGFFLTLSKEVPQLITKALWGFLERLCSQSGLQMETLLEKAYFALHPGGPKIISSIEQQLKLKTDQTRHSRDVLEQFGNMSSATLPHIWQKMLEDEKITNGSLVVSLAFGPGLTIAGALFEVVQCSLS